MQSRDNWIFVGRFAEIAHKGLKGSLQHLLLEEYLMTARPNNIVRGPFLMRYLELFITSGIALPLDFNTDGINPPFKESYELLYSLVFATSLMGVNRAHTYVLACKTVLVVQESRDRP